jgi:hypothetical protein
MLKPCENGDCPFNNSCPGYITCLNDQLNRSTKAAR